MAERRMFAKTIIDSDAFIEMPMSARLLYYDLGMRADDDGFVNAPRKIMKFVGASNDDMNILIARKFVIAFDNGVVVIKHWRIHNYIRRDTYKETTYQEQKALLSYDENNAYTLHPSTSRQRAVDEPSTQDSIGKVSIGKNNLVSKNNNKKEKQNNVLDITKELTSDELLYQHTFEIFEEEFGRPLSQKESDILAEFIEKYGHDATITALREASIQQVYKMPYIEEILKAQKA